MKSKLIPLALVSACLLAGCSGMDGFWCDLSGTPEFYYSQRPVPLAELEAFPRQCLAGDTEVMALAECQTTSAACYQLDTGNWCTDSRAAICPMSAAPMAVDTDCPGGSNCRIYTSNLRCRSVADIKG